MEESLGWQGHRLFCWFPVFLGGGSALYFALKTEPGFYTLFLFVLALIAGIGVRLLARPEVTYPLILRVTGMGVATFSAGFLLAYGETHRQTPFPAFPYQAAWIRGVITHSEFLPSRYGQEHVNSGKWRVTLKKVVFEEPWDERSSPLERTLRLTLRSGDVPHFMAGAQVRVKALLKKTPLPAYPGAADFQRESWFSGRAGGGRALSDLTEVTEFPPHNAVSDDVLARWTGLREFIARQIKAVIPGQDGAFAATVLCGDTSSLSLQTRQDFAASGLAHLLAVAGLHLGLVMAFCAFTIRALLVTWPRLALTWPCRTIAYVSALVIGGVYVALTGFHLPGLRALGMAFLVVMALLAGRRVLSLRSLALVALVLEITKPSRVLDVSFQMSFMAVMALIVGYEVLRSPLSELRQRSWLWRKVGLPLIFLALTSLLAGSAVLPVSMAYFGAFQPWFIVANLVAVPVMGFWIMPLGLVSLAVMPMGWERLPLHMMEWGIRLVRHIAFFMAHAPWASLPVPFLPGWGLVMILTGLCLFCLWRGKVRFAGLILLCGGMASPWVGEKPVFLVSPDGTEIAFHSHHHLYVRPYKKHDFVEDAWQNDFALPVETMPEQCRKNMCFMPYKNKNILMIWPSYKGRTVYQQDGSACSQVSLVINLSKTPDPCQGIMTLDRHSVRQGGSWAVYRSSGGGWRVLSDRMVRGQRPWVMEPDQEGDQGWPLARSE